MLTIPVAASRSPWLLRVSQGQAPRLRMIGFPFAGGGASLFRRWLRHLPSSIEVVGVQLPGRENRLREAPLRDLPMLVAAVTRELEPFLTDGLPYVLFGHSLGALVGFEVARRLRRLGAPGPGALLVSARTAPQLPSSRQPLHHLPDMDLIREIRRLDGIPVEIVEHREMLDLILPALRADLALDEQYVYENEPPLDAPILALGGREDPEVALDDLAQWAAQTRCGFTLRTFPGGHFFLQTHLELFTTDLFAYLAPLTPVS